MANSNTTVGGTPAFGIAQLRSISRESRRESGRWLACLRCRARRRPNAKCARCAYQLNLARFPVYRDMAGFDFVQSEVNEALVRQGHRETVRCRSRAPAHDGSGIDLSKVHCSRETAHGTTVDCCGLWLDVICRALRIGGGVILVNETRQLALGLSFILSCLP